MSSFQQYVESKVFSYTKTLDKVLIPDLARIVAEYAKPATIIRKKSIEVDWRVIIRITINSANLTRDPDVMLLTYRIHDLMNMMKRDSDASEQSAKGRKFINWFHYLFNRYYDQLVKKCNHPKELHFYRPRTAVGLAFMLAVKDYLKDDEKISRRTECEVFMKNYMKPIYNDIIGNREVDDNKITGDTLIYQVMRVAERKIVEGLGIDWCSLGTAIIMLLNRYYYPNTIEMDSRQVESKD